MLGGGETIDIAYGTVQLSIADLTYKLNPTDPSKLGTLVIEGPGKAMLADKAMVLRTFAWNQTMQVLPQEVGHLLWIAGAVNAKMRDGGSVVADDLLVAFELTSNPNKTPSANAAKSLNASSDADSQVSLRLDKLRARGSVKVDTSQLAAETDTLLVLFDHIQSLPNRDDEQTESIGPMLNPASGARQKFWITEPQTPSGNSQASSVATTIAPVAGPRPVLAGNAITANLVLSGNRVVAQDLSVLKNVRLKHELQTKTAPLPLVYTGDSLRLITGMGDDRVQIAGTPARIDLGDGFFEGPLVVISGRENRVSIRDRGTFQLPITILPSGQGDAIRWLKPPRCEFTGELTFNGQLVEITDSVMIAGQLSVGQKAEAWDVNATAPRLQLTLDRSINVTNPTDAKTAAVDRISLVGESNDVLLVATQLDPTGQPIGRHVQAHPARRPCRMDDLQQKAAAIPRRQEARDRGRHDDRIAHQQTQQQRCTDRVLAFVP